MEKVKITQELADAIEWVRKHSDENILFDVTYIKNVCEGDKFDAPKLMPIYNHIQKVGFMEYFKALVVGYEVEETPEDKVKVQYESPKHFYNKNDDTYIDVYRKGIKFVLDTFNIKIEGIN